MVNGWVDLKAESIRPNETRGILRAGKSAQYIPAEKMAKLGLEALEQQVKEVYDDVTQKLEDAQIEEEKEVENMIQKQKKARLQHCNSQCCCHMNGSLLRTGRARYALRRLAWAQMEKPVWQSFGQV